MKSIVLFILLVACSFTSMANEQAASQKPTENQQQQALSQLQEPMYRPLIERYILDELRAVREDQMRLRADIEKKISHSQLDTADRAITYTTDTINNVLFLITAAASILVVVGWTSFRDIKSKVEDIVSLRVGTITDEYEKRLQVIEEKLRERSEEILNNQKKISITNEVHSLWMRANLESDMNSKIEIYDEILNRKPEDVEAIAYKADALLELGQTNTAIALCNQALEIDSDYGYAYWQRACAYSMLYKHADAMADIRMALEYAPNLKNELQHEPAFASLADNQSFNELVNS
ncbi:tetratricopeptide repeat protein [Pseudoalteromonas flavipulchra]|nr:tetratricopeptide domain protein [Pseudoalteromonas flavipulchra NCIMB 2033 = ATCC BAA-314]MBD0782218.1 tetratricopeptide repeat protein [Pseudoalteromonas flavipulchra]